MAEGQDGQKTLIFILVFYGVLDWDHSLNLMTLSFMNLIERLKMQYNSSVMSDRSILT